MTSYGSRWTSGQALLTIVPDQLDGRDTMRTQLRKETSAYSRLDLLVAIATIALIGMVGLSVLGSSAVRSDSAVCANNLRQIGRAFNMWASDHGGQNPWWVHYNEGGSFIPFNGPPPPGGLLNVPGIGPVPAALRNNSWLQMAYIGPELQNAALLVCPTDRTKFRAKEFSNNSTNGLFSPNFQNRGNSYLIGLHGISQYPSSMLSGDRSLKEDIASTGCTANVGTAAGIIVFPPSPAGWSSDLHPDGGNLLSYDGHVEFLSATGRVPYFAPGPEENAAIHFLKPN